MTTTEIQHSQYQARETSTRIPEWSRYAGLAAIAGAIVLVGSLFWQEFLVFRGVGTLIEDPTHAIYYLSQGSLLLAFGGLLIGLIGLSTQQRRMGTYGRLWKPAIGLTGLGLGLAALGFLIVVGAPLIGSPELKTPGDMVIGLGFLLFIPVGSFLLGLAFLRARTESRLVASLLIVGAITWIVLLVVQSSLPPVVGITLFVPFGAAWVVIGYELWTNVGEGSIG